MKKKILCDLIKGHYGEDPVKFFQATIEVMKEFKDDPDSNEIYKSLSNFLKSKIHLRPESSNMRINSYDFHLTSEDMDTLGINKPAIKRPNI